MTTRTRSARIGTRPKNVPVLAWLELHSHSEPGRLDTDCQVYDGSHSGKGYGRLMVVSVRWATHRLAWIERHGPIPPDTPFALHRCDNPPCFADGHLFLGTHADNAADRNAKGRCKSGIRQREKTHCKRGHEYSPENTKVRPRGNGLARHCIACDEIRAEAKRKHLRRREQAPKTFSERTERAA